MLGPKAVGGSRGTGAGLRRVRVCGEPSDPAAGGAGARGPGCRTPAGGSGRPGGGRASRRFALTLFDPESLVEAFEGIELVYYLIHSMASGKDFPELDRRVAAHVRDAAATAGVGRIIYLGGLQPREAASAHLDSRRETGEVLRSGSVPVTEIRAGIVVGPGSAAFEVIRDLVYHLPVMVTPRWVDSMTQPIALDDLIEYLLRLPETEGSASRIHDVGGPEALRYRDLLTGFARVIGKRLLIVPVPVLTPRLSSYWLNLVTAVPTNVARPLIDGLRHDLVIDPECRPGHFDSSPSPHL